MRGALSYTGTILTPSGRPGSSSLIFFLMALMTFRAFSPERIMMMPLTTSPVPFCSTMPLLSSGPSIIRATSFNKTGEPFAEKTTVFSRSSFFSIYPLERMISSVSACSRTRPPTSWLEARTAAVILEMGMS